MKSLLVAIPLLAGLSTAAINDLCQAQGYQGTCQTTTWCGNRGGSQPVVGACPNDPNNVKCCLFPRCSSSRGYCMGTASGLCSTSFVSNDSPCPRNSSPATSSLCCSEPQGHRLRSSSLRPPRRLDKANEALQAIGEKAAPQPRTYPQSIPLSIMKISATLALAASLMLGQAAAAPAAATTSVDVAPIPAGSLLLVDESGSAINATAYADDADAELAERAVPGGTQIFSIGYAFCSYTTPGPGGTPPTGGNREDLFTWGRNPTELGCVQHSNANVIPWGWRTKPFTHNKVCGRSVNFYPNNGNLDFYINGGNGQLLGTCYPTSGKKHNCVDFLAGGTCVVQTRYRCLSSGRDPVICG
ncbi:hypothetical protein RB601_000345 [Gaeumannomyces tritici]